MAGSPALPPIVADAMPHRNLPQRWSETAQSETDTPSISQPAAARYRAAAAMCDGSNDFPPPARASTVRDRRAMNTAHGSGGDDGKDSTLGDQDEKSRTARCLL